MDEEGIFFLSKWKYGVVIFDIKTKKRIDLLKKLAGKKHLDIQVLCGASEMVKVRMVAYKLSDAQTAEKIRKAKQDRNRRTNHKADFYFLLGYVIFITNVEKDTWAWEKVTEAYRVRWNVEILFKSWKSGLDIKKMIPDAKLHTNGVESVLYLMMLYIAWFQLLVYAPLYWFCYERGIYLSIIKVAKWMSDNIMRCISKPITNSIKREIAYYCCYETRLRTNASQHLDLFFEDLT